MAQQRRQQQRRAPEVSAHAPGWTNESHEESWGNAAALEQLGLGGCFGGEAEDDLAALSGELGAGMFQRGLENMAVRGTSGGGSELPFLEQIQAAFGDHDVTDITAHTGAMATAASEAMGAHAFAAGDDVAFGGVPDLHTAAHEAAHVIQQRGGVRGVGRAGDPNERLADAVADRVVQGRSAEDLLGPVNHGMPGWAVQLDEKKKAWWRTDEEEAPAEEEAEYEDRDNWVIETEEDREHLERENDLRTGSCEEPEPANLPTSEMPGPYKHDEQHPGPERPVVITATNYRGETLKGYKIEWSVTDAAGLKTAGETECAGGTCRGRGDKPTAPGRASVTVWADGSAPDNVPHIEGSGLVAVPESGAIQVFAEQTPNTGRVKGEVTNTNTGGWERRDGEKLEAAAAPGGVGYNSTIELDRIRNGSSSTSTMTGVENDNKRPSGAFKVSGG